MPRFALGFILRKFLGSMKWNVILCKMRRRIKKKTSGNAVFLFFLTQSASVMVENERMEWNDNRSFWKLCEAGDIEGVQAAIDNGVDVNDAN